MSEGLIEIRIEGPGPYGFRLFGGEGDPLIIVKLRTKSKAHDAGLREGDVVLGINGRTCETISHGVAMTLLESTVESLHLHVYRGSKDRESILSAYESLGSRLRPVSPGTVPPNRSIYSIQPSDAAPPAASEAAGQPAVEPVKGNAIQKFTTETESQDLGGVTLTKVTNHLGTATNDIVVRSLADEEGRHSGTQTTTVFHVPKFKLHPLLWTPAGSVSETGKPSDQFHVNRAITIDIIPVEDKDNLAPDTKNLPDFVRVPEDPARFKVYKTSAKRLLWQPGFESALPEREPSPAFQFLPDGNEFQLPGKSTEGAPNGYDATETERDPYGLTPQLIRVLTTEGPEDDLIAHTRKKIFADSSFYDDPEQKYPTIEEQIKMARNVAQSLSAPDNITARGQLMFMRLKEKANHWTSDLPPFDGLLPSPTQPRSSRLHKANESYDIFYHPTRWEGKRAKKVRSVVPYATKFDGYPENFATNSDAFPKTGVRVKSYQPADYNRSSRKAKRTGTPVSHECVGLSDDLREMKGRGATLFAIRRAKAAEEEYSYNEGQKRKSGIRGRGDSSDPSQPQASARRLKELISISKSYMSPWESPARHQMDQEPWHMTSISDERRKGKELTDDLWRPGQTTTGKLPSFLGKPSGVYRSVRFQVPLECYEPVTDF